MSSSDGRKFWYIVTNTDKTPTGGNLTVDPNDRSKYWNTDVAIGKEWNDPGNVAINNAKGRFPDGFYTVKIWAKDAKGNLGQQTKSILLDNWPQGLGRMNNPNGTVTVWGNQFTPNATVPIYAVTQPIDPQPGDDLSEIGTLVGTGYTDSDGNIIPFEIPNPSGGGFFLIGDYDNGDGIFEPELDGLVVFGHTGREPDGGRAVD